MPRPAPRTLKVIRSNFLTPHMLRVTLGGPELANFPKDQESAYVKLIFPQPVDGHSLTRTYTISGQRHNEIDVDFAIHAGEGPASTWAMNAQPGNRILVGGPGPRKLINTSADWFLLAGDMTACLRSRSISLIFQEMHRAMWSSKWLMSRTSSHSNHRQTLRCIGL